MKAVKIRREWWEYITRYIPAELRAECCAALMEYAFTSTPPASNEVRLALGYLLAAIDSERERTELISRKRAEAGAVGGSKQMKANEANESKRSKCKQNKQMQANEANASVSDENQLDTYEKNAENAPKTRKNAENAPIYIYNNNLNNNNNIEDIYIDREKEKKEKTARFKKPTRDEIAAIVEAKGLAGVVDVDAFFDYYESVGWEIGRSRKKMKSVPAAVSNWARRQKDYKQEKHQNNERERFDAAVVRGFAAFDGKAVPPANDLPRI